MEQLRDQAPVSFSGFPGACGASTIRTASPRARLRTTGATSGRLPRPSSLPLKNKAHPNSLRCMKTSEIGALGNRLSRIYADTNKLKYTKTPVDYTNDGCRFHMTQQPHNLERSHQCR